MKDYSRYIERHCDGCGHVGIAEDMSPQKPNVAMPTEWVCDTCLARVGDRHHIYDQQVRLGLTEAAKALHERAGDGQ